MSISIIVAVSKNGVIGSNNDLPWNLPSDLKMFKTVTTGNIVVMGRKCYESIPEKYRPLPNRLNIVLSRDNNYKTNTIVYNNLESVITDFKDDNRDIFIIGGGEIYKQGFDLADTVYLTRVNKYIDGDVLLEGFDESNWILVESSEPIMENDLEFKFLKYKKPI